MSELGVIAQSVSILAPVINCVQMAPQVYKTYLTKRVDELSGYSLGMLLATSILWFVHGYFIQDLSLQVSGLISILINVTLCIMFYKYKNNNNNNTNNKKQ